MGELAERLSLLSVNTRSPDGGLEAAVHGRRELRIAFAGDAYQGYRAAELARQLESLAAVLWSRYRRRYLHIVASWDDEEETTPTDADREFQRRLEQLEVSGVSPHGWVSVRSRALVSWHVQITDEPVGSLAEQEFLAELQSAVTAVLADYDAQVILLTDEIYDIGLPRAMRVTG
jgi:hypothetical protein